jgi:hypothetical protein
MWPAVAQGGQIWHPVWPCWPNVIYWREGDKFGIAFDQVNQIWPAGDRGNKFKIVWQNQIKGRRDKIGILHLCTSVIAEKSITDHSLTCLVAAGHQTIQFLLIIILWNHFCNNTFTIILRDTFGSKSYMESYAESYNKSYVLTAPKAAS